MKKRIICIILVSAMLISLLSFPCYASTGGYDISQRAVSLLGGLGILTAEEYNADIAVTRSAFAVMMARFIGIDKVEFSGVSNFSDVNSSENGYSEINHLAQSDIISVSSDGQFRPGNLITSTEAVKMLICAMNYNVFAQSSGGYPTGYMTIAGKLGILKHADIGGDSITMKQAAILIYNALFVNVNDTYIYAGEYVSNTRKDTNFLNAYFNVYESIGTVTSTSYTSLESGDKLHEGKVKINNMIYSAGKSGIDDYIGRRVVFYYKDNVKKTIVAFYSYDNGKTLELTPSNIVDFKNREYKYIEKEEDTKVKTAEISASASVFLNKGFVQYDEQIFIPKSGKIRLVDTDNDKKYDLVFITSYVNIVVDSINASDGIINAKYGYPSIDLNFSDSETVVRIVDHDNNEYDIRDLGEWDVLACAISPDKKRTDIILTRDYVNGIIKADKNGDSLTIGKRDYKLSEFYPQTGVYLLDVGKKGDFLLDIDGKIAAYVPSDGLRFVMGYLMGIRKGSGISSKVYVNIYTENDKVEEFALEDKITVDAVKYKKANCSKIFDLLSGGKLIRYEVNKKGNICSIDTPNTQKSISEDNALYPATERKTLKMRYNQFAGYIALNSATKVFVVPNDINDTDSFAFRNMTFFRHDSEYTVEGYNESNDVVYSDAVICYTNNADGLEKKYDYDCHIIERIALTIDEDGNTVESVALWSRGVRKVLNSINDEYVFKTKELGEGDIIRFGTAKGGKISDIDVIYDYDPATNTGEFKYTKYRMLENVNATYRVMPCWVYMVDGNSISVTDRDLSTISDEEAANLTAEDFEKYLIDRAKIMVYDHTKRADKFFSATASDLNDYIHSGNQSSFVVLQTYAGTVTNIMVYK